jgi:flagellin
MAFSIQTNVNALVAQENLSTNSKFQSQTIQRLTSGYRINSSADDAAGLAVANKFRSDTAELSQGVRNANDAISTLQIMDGGLTNISKMLDRMKTLATESATNGFTGNRATLQMEYGKLVSEIDRQANNIGLGATNGQYKKAMAIYVGGGSDQTNATVSFDLSTSGVGSAALSLATTNVSGDAYTETAGSRVLNSTDKLLVGATQSFVFSAIGTGAKAITVTLAGGTDGITSDQALQTLNSSLSGLGITASKNASGFLQFTSGSGFTLANVADASVAGTGLATTASAAFTVPNAGVAASVAGNDTGSALAAVAAIAAAVKSLGIVQGTVGTAQNQLSYGINLAQSQITNYSAAESAIRDADIAAEAANLTKAQVLQQSSIAAMAQANSAPQAVLALLKG